MGNVNFQLLRLGEADKCDRPLRYPSNIADRNRRLDQRSFD